MKNKNITRTEPWTEKEVRDNLNKFNWMLTDNIILMDILQKKFGARNVYCLGYLPTEVDYYEILINGEIIVDLEFDKFDKNIVINSVKPIKTYINEIKNEHSKKFHEIASKIGKEI